MPKERKIWIALPAMNEYEWLPATLDAIHQQDYQNFHLVVCVNQPEEYRDSQNDSMQNIYHNNQACLQLLQSINQIPVTVLDRSSRGKGWPAGKGSVGAARKELMDYIASQAEKKDIIVSMDADTRFTSGYFSSINQIFTKYTDLGALANPYYHKTTGHIAEDRAILRYEIYMRNYALNLFRINSPYRFTALGSAIATTKEMYDRIGGMTPKKSGEDFYFLQKIVKSGKLCLHNEELVYPAARFSDRVFFGTGPAMIKGNQGNWSSYPVYAAELFDDVKKTMDNFPLLYHKDIPTPMDTVFNTKNSSPWQPLRSNATSEKQFVKACHQKMDGLRILQYLKSTHNNLSRQENQILTNNLQTWPINLPEETYTELHEHSQLTNVSTNTLLEIRDLLFNREHQIQKDNPITRI